MAVQNITGNLTTHGTVRGTLNTKGRLSGALSVGGGTTDYNELENKPTYNGHIIEGDLTSESLGIWQPKNFTTEEQNTGLKWIDGKDIYFKTFDLSSKILPDNTWSNDILNTANTGINIIFDKSYFKLAGYGTLFPYSYYRGQNEYFTYDIIVDKMNVRPNMNAGTNVLAGIICIFYTKN